MRGIYRQMPGYSSRTATTWLAVSGGRYVEPSIRPDDSRFGENPNRLQRHTQFQVILKPDPGNSQDLFIRSLSALGINVNDHDIRFVEDNWESPVLGAWGLGWEIWMDGMEITQFTYFQQAGSLQLMPVSVEITYGLERILMLLQGVDHFKKIQYAEGITYGELFLENEREMSGYYLEHASVAHLQKHFDLFEEEARSLLDLGLAIPAYDQLLKTSHTFNILDSRGFVGVTERARYFGRMRSLARQCAQLWLKTRESLGHPLGTFSEPDHLVCPKEVLEAAVSKVPGEPRMLVLEIGTEELPPSDVMNASQQLKDVIVQLLEKQRLSHGKVLAFGTPRRLVVQVESLCSRQVENEVEVRGPPVSKAFDQQGNPTKAADGFCRRYCVPLDSLYRKAEGKTEYVYARVVESARLALEPTYSMIRWVGRLLGGRRLCWFTTCIYYLVFGNGGIKDILQEWRSQYVKLKDFPSLLAGYLPSVLATSTMLHVIQQVEPCHSIEYQNQLLGVLNLSKVLSEDLPSTIARISFPKSMRWNSQVMFSRPIRWVLALHGDAVIPFTFAGLLSGNLSYGLRNTPSATVRVENAESYSHVMQNAGISVEIEERKRTILELSKALAKGVNGCVVMQSALLDEVANLVEAPVPVLGKFKESFLELPKDLLVMPDALLVDTALWTCSGWVMQKHQKYFAITDEDGELLPYFIAVANGTINELVVIKGNEAVLRARYEDAKFFYEMDTRKKFSEFRSQLNGILFHEKLGTMLDKMKRVQSTVTRIGLALGVTGDVLRIVEDAASLAMSDLATAVVTEFTSLSGIMAQHYALRDGYSEQISEALFEIILPRFSGDILPKTDAGTILSIADRLDSLVGLFGAGCQSSSSNDPFGLRRISYGLVQVLVENNRNLDLRHALELAAATQPMKMDAGAIDEVDKGISPEVVRSILTERANWPCLAAKSAYEMEALSKGELLPKVVEAYSRPTRIVRGKDVTVDIEVRVEGKRGVAMNLCDRADAISLLGSEDDARQRPTRNQRDEMEPLSSLTTQT
ncbi:glycine-tRNA ligase [Actinidia rufa]|uniref:glycine--tRNA ligase n=1 Tax=Actinidia rufa TaxID=165716 RepID=A0A7J0E4A5_9ERIC|nr:glycine-tRNA ligase [Actinidia rufa]